MHLCDLSHTDPPACVVMSVCKGGRMLRACGYTRAREHTAGPRGACCGSLSATTVALLAHVSGAGGSQVLQEVLHQHSDRSSVFSCVPVSGCWLFPHRGADHPQNPPRCIQLPLCSTGEADPVLPLTQHAATDVEKEMLPIPPTWQRSLGISAAPSESSGAVWFWGVNGGMAGQTSTFWWVTCKKPLVPTRFCPIYFAEREPRPGLKVGAAFKLVDLAVHTAGLVGNTFWSVLLCPSPGCTARERTSCIPCPVPHTPYPATHIPHPVASYVLRFTLAPSIRHPTWDPVEKGLGPLPLSTGCTPWVLGKLEASQGANRLPCMISKVTKKAMVPSVKERTLQWHYLQLSSQSCASSELKP